RCRRARRRAGAEATGAPALADAFPVSHPGRTGGAWSPDEGRAMVDVVVVGLVCRDIVVTVEELPVSGSVPVGTRIETLGGAANQAVGARQLGLSAGLVGVVGQDA